MKIVTIKNNKMYNSKNGDGVHYYAFFWNKKYKRYNAIRLTHLAHKDEKRYTDANNGYYKPIYLKKIDKYAFNGITNERYISDKDGNPLTLSHIEDVKQKRLTYYQYMKIKRFGIQLYSKGSRLNNNFK